ncbi:hypothetical protein KDL01_40635, partial [Actinospica durhamensis]
MAVIHRTTLAPSKLELLTAWLPSRPWYVGGAGEPRLANAGGFRLDDPAGEVGIEFIVVTDTAPGRPVTYLAPLTYRAAPLAGAEHALVGTMEHGVLGRRWAYDGVHDPVFVAQLLALIEGSVQAQDQSASDTLDREVTRDFTGRAEAVQGWDKPTVVDGRDGTELRNASGVGLDVRRVLRAAAADDATSVRPDAIGHVAGSWLEADSGDGGDGAD